MLQTSEICKPYYTPRRRFVYTTYEQVVPLATVPFQLNGQTHHERDS